MYGARASSLPLFGPQPGAAALANFPLLNVNPASAGSDLIDAFLPSRFLFLIGPAAAACCRRPPRGNEAALARRPRWNYFNRQGENSFLESKRARLMGCSKYSWNCSGQSGTIVRTKIFNWSSEINPMPNSEIQWFYYRAFVFKTSRLFNNVRFLQHNLDWKFGLYWWKVGSMMANWNWIHYVSNSVLFRIFDHPIIWRAPLWRRRFRNFFKYLNVRHTSPLRTANVDSGI